MASDGYPQAYKSGYEITVDADFAAELYVAGAKLEDGKVLTAGGRVLGVTACAPTLKEAISAAYAESEKVHFENAYKRSDIGQRALLAIK
jgi:phosphoribosylamine--glycine ligase